MSERTYWFQVLPEAPSPPVPLPTMREIAELVAERYELTLEDMKSPARPRHIAWPRQEAMALMYATGRYSLPQIGRFFGGRDHSTVFHAVRAYNDRQRGERRAA